MYCKKYKKILSIHGNTKMPKNTLSTVLSISALPIDDLFTISIDFDHFRSISITSDPKFK